MTLAQIDRMAENLRRLGVQAVSVGGGEPLVRDDLAQAVESFARRGMSVRVLTNGVIEDHGLLDRVIDAGCRGFSVSLDSLDSRRLDEVAGTKGVLEKVKSSISHLSSRLKRVGGLGLINTVVSRHNLDELDDILDYAGSVGFYLSLIPLEAQNMGGACLVDSKSLTSYHLSDEQKGRVEEIFWGLREKKSRGAPLFNSSVYLKKAGELLSGKRVEWKCLAGGLYFSVGPDGGFSICHRHRGWAGVEGFVADDDFVEKFRSHCKDAGVAVIRENCRDCFRPCWVDTAQIFTDVSAFFEMAGIQLRVLLGKKNSEKRKP